MCHRWHMSFRAVHVYVSTMTFISLCLVLAAIQSLHNAVKGWDVQYRLFQCYEGVQSNAISITRGWGGLNFTEKKRYVTLE